MGRQQIEHHDDRLSYASSMTTMSITGDTTTEMSCVTRRFSTDTYDSATIETMRRTSFGVSLLNTMTNAIGLGAVLMPISFSEMGLFTSAGSTILIALTTYASVCFLCQCARRTSSQSYEELSQYYFGFWGVRVTNLANILQLFTLVVCFLRIPQESIAKMIESSSNKGLEITPFVRR